MPKTKQQKQEMWAALGSLFENAPGIIFSTFSHVDIKGVETLRRVFRKAGISYTVFKKTILKKVLESRGIDTGEVRQWYGNIGVASSLEDEIVLAKTFVSESKGLEGLEIKAGMLEGKFIDASTVKHLASLPGYDQLIAKVIGLLQTPLYALVNVLQGPERGLLNVLSQIKSQKEK